MVFIPGWTDGVPSPDESPALARGYIARWRCGVVILRGRESGPTTRPGQDRHVQRQGH